MRYTRFEFKDHNKTDLRELILRFFILVPVIGLAAGFIITRFILIPNLLNEEKVSNVEKVILQDDVEPASYMYSHIKPRKYFAVQIGVFRESNNAETFVNRLRASGFPGYKGREEEYIRVFSYASNSSDFIKEKMEHLKALKFDTIQKEINIDIHDVPETLKTNREFITAGRIINSLGDKIDNYCHLLSQYEYGVIDDNTLEDKYIELSKDIKDETGLSHLIEGDGNSVYSSIVDCFHGFCHLMEEIPQDIVEHQEKLIEAIQLFKKAADNLNRVIKN